MMLRWRVLRCLVHSKRQKAKEGDYKERVVGAKSTGSHPSPAYPALQVSLAITAVGSAGLDVTTVTVTQCV